MIKITINQYTNIICFIIDNMETLMNLYDWINFVIFALQN